LAEPRAADQAWPREVVFIPFGDLCRFIRSSRRREAAEDRRASGERRPVGKQPTTIWARMDLGSAKAIDIELPPKLFQFGDALREQEVEIHSHPSPGTASSLADLFDAAGEIERACRQIVMRAVKDVGAGFQRLGERYMRSRTFGPGFGAEKRLGESNWRACARVR